MLTGTIFMTPNIVRDLTTGRTYDIDNNVLRLPVGTLVVYTLNHGVVDSLGQTLTGLVMGNTAVDDVSERSTVLPAWAQGVYPGLTPIRFRGTTQSVTMVDALSRTLLKANRRIDLTDPSQDVPPTVNRGENVEQDDTWTSPAVQGQTYYYNGTGSAWTTRVHTCTALAMWSMTAQRSYLSHADAGTPPATVGQHMGAYLTQVVQAGANLATAGELTVVLCLAEDTLASLHTSCEVIAKALAHLTPAQAKAVFTAAKCQVVGPDEVIVVSAAAAPKVMLDADARLRYLLGKYSLSGEPTIRAHLLKAIASAYADKTLDPPAYGAAKMAKEKHDDELLDYLYLLPGHTKEQAKKLWEL
jgi:hypothetical protein